MEESREQIISTPLSRIRASRTLLDTFIQAEHHQPFAVFWSSSAEGDESQRFSVGEMRVLVGQATEALRNAGISSGDHLTLILPQGPELIAAFLGALLTGAVPAILAYPNFKVDPEKYRTGLRGVLDHIGAKAALIDSGFPTPLREELEPREQVLELSLHPAKTEDCETRLQPDCRPSDLALIQHSAGTTGLQKAVGLSHAIVLEQLESLARVLELRNSDRVASWLPLYHDMGLVAAFLLPLVSGIPVVMQSPLHWVIKPESFLDLVTREKATITWLPNFAFQFMARRTPEEKLSSLDLSSLRLVISCSEPVLAESLDEFQKCFSACGLQADSIQSSYAMAENVFAVTQSMPVASPLRLRVERNRLLREGRIQESKDPDETISLTLVSSGRPLPGTALRIVDAEGRVLLPGSVGEIQIRSRSLFEGYLGRTESRLTAFQDDWYRSGDRGFLYQGELFVLGRQDDVIIVAGRNIFPEDVERIAARHGAIQDGRVVAFGIENPALGTRDLIVIAEVRKDLEGWDSSRISLEIRQSIREELDVSPRRALIVKGPWIIKSTAGKPARSATREKFFKLRLESHNPESLS